MKLAHFTLVKGTIEFYNGATRRGTIAFENGQKAVFDKISEKGIRAGVRELEIDTPRDYFPNLTGLAVIGSIREDPKRVARVVWWAPLRVYQEACAEIAKRPQLDGSSDRPSQGRLDLETKTREEWGSLSDPRLALLTGLF